MIALKPIVQVKELLDIKFQLDMQEIGVKQVVLSEPNSQNIYAFSVSIPDMIEMRNWTRQRGGSEMKIEYKY